MHPNATTNKSMRAYIQNSKKSITELAKELGTSRATVRKWKNRNTVDDKSHAVKNLLTTLNHHEENVIIFLRELLNLSIDDMLIVSRKLFGRESSRAGLGRLLKRRNKNKVIVDHGSVIDNHPKKGLEDEKTSKELKLILLHPSCINENFVYILMIESKSKVMHISWLEKKNTAVVLKYLHHTITQFSSHRLLLAIESDNYRFYLEGLRSNHAEKKFACGLYSEKAFLHLPVDELVNSISVIISQISRLTDISVNNSLRAFRFIYNHKTHLRSLRKTTPKYRLSKNA